MKTLKITQETHKELLKLKIEENCKTINEVITGLIISYRRKKDDKSKK